jgi:hypothetical protein
MSQHEHFLNTVILQELLKTIARFFNQLLSTIASKQQLSNTYCQTLQLRTRQTLLIFVHRALHAGRNHVSSLLVVFLRVE